MNRNRSGGSVFAAVLAFIVLCLGAVLMTLNLFDVTARVRDFQHALFVQAMPGVAAAAPTGDLTAINPAAMDTGVWANNAAALWPELLFLLIGGGILLLLLARLRLLWAALFVIVAIAAAVAGSWFLFARGQFFIEVLMPVLVLGLAFAGGGLVANAARPRRIPATSVATIAERPDVPAQPVRPRIAPEKRTVTYLVCQLSGVGNSANNLDAAGTLTLLDTTLEPLIAQVRQLHGVVANAGASRVSAVWNGVAEDSEHAAHACEAALRMLSALGQMKDQHGEGTPYDPLRIAIGIATGPAVVGGAADPNAYSVIGPCVEMAEMLSRLSGRYGPGILVSEETRNLVEKNFALLEIDKIASEPDGNVAQIYALYGNPLVRASPKFRALSTFHDHLFQAIGAQRWGDARTLIEQCNNLSGAVPQLYNVHLARVAWYETHPLHADWDGAFRPPVV